jgi:hypothetical protein
MRRNVAGSPSTWIAALFFVVLIDAAITRTRVLWAPTGFENTRDMGQIVFAHTYQAARRIYAPENAPPIRVAFLGNSRIWLPAREAYLRRELDRVAPALDIRLDNLAIFGALVGDVEVLSRHLERLDPTLVVLAIGASDLVPRPAAPLNNLASRLMRIGWSDGPAPPSGVAERVDRWGRTLWPLYRFREFARAALGERVHPGADAGPFPDRFETTRGLFDYMHGEKGADVERAYRAWRAEPSLERFVKYLEVGSGGYLRFVQGYVGEGVQPTADGPALRVFESLLRRLADGPWTTLLLLMPENPLLGEDVGGRYHVPGFSEEAAVMVRDIAARCGVPVIDARSWMPADAFIDFDHLMPDLGGFQVPLVREIVHAVRS